jgi:AcrR family transcriptional regulator
MSRTPGSSPFAPATKRLVTIAGARVTVRSDIPPDRNGSFCHPTSRHGPFRFRNLEGLPLPSSDTARRSSIGARRNPATEIAVLAAAREVLAERGFAGFSIDEVARRAGAGKPTIYRWWPSRADLLVEVYLGDRAARLPEPDTGNLPADLTALARAILSGWRGSPAGQALRGLIAEAQGSEAALVALWERLMPGWDQPIRAVFGQAARRGEVEAADIDVLSELYSGFLWRRLLTGQTDDDRAAIERMARILASGRGRK